MTTIDIHTHLLSSKVSFDRAFDKFAIKFFAKKFGLEPKELFKNPYESYVKALINNTKTSRYIDNIVIFGVDAKVNAQGEILHIDKTVCASNDDVLKIYETNKDEIIPFFSINPLRPNALDLIDYYYEKGFKGAKFLQNYWEVDTTQDRFTPYFEKLKKLNLPLIIHVGNENTISSKREFESIKMLFNPVQIGVNTICAHMAIRYDGAHPFHAVSRNPKHFGDEYFKLLELLERHANLYADISAILTPARARALRHLSGQGQIHGKLLYGSDFPVPYSLILNSYDLKLKKRFELNRIQNPFDRGVSAVMEYFGADNQIWSNHKKILDE
ncbi:MAG: amidohydrolase family protein [Campylobacter sp.]|nr:amidohydrolase family protein [Campylobacter sp.]